jgi:CRISPR-associated Csx3 family protein
MMILLEIQLNDVLAPAQLPELLRAAEGAVPAAGTEPVVLSGRLPVWAFAALTHHYHPRPWVGTFDPRLGGSVVVETHVAGGPSLGDVVSVEGATKALVAF